MMLLILLVTLLTNPIPDTYPRQPGLDFENYAFSLTLSDDTDEIRGRAEIDIRVVSAGVTEVRLDLVGLHDGKGMTVDGVRLGDTNLSYRHAEDAIFISLPEAPPVGSRIQLTVEYHGIPATGLKIAPNKHGDRTFFSDNWPNRARHWLPTVDHPYDKANCEFIVRAPARYQVISNGLLIEETDLGNGQRLTHWKQSVPIASWLYVLGVAEFAVQRVGTFDGKELQTWVYRQDRDAGFYDFAVPSYDALAYYSATVGPYAYEKLANIQSNSVGGGMEAASAVFYGDNSVTGERSVRWRNVIIHEIAHQWFGNAVTEADWDDVWLSEGFATYYTLLYREYAYGRDDFVDGLKDARRRVSTFFAERPDYRIVHDNLDDMSQVTTGMTYQKGAWILHMLRNRIGDEAYRKGIQKYYAAYFNSNSTTADFRRHLEEASGQDLGAFLNQWLYQGGHPVLQGGWTWKDGVVTVTLDPAHLGGHAFDLPVEIGIVLDGAMQIETMRVSDGPATLRIPSEVRPDRVEIDPRTVLLADWTLEEVR